MKEVTRGQRSNQLNYVPTRQINKMRNNQYLCGFAQFAYRARFEQNDQNCSYIQTAHKPPVRNHRKSRNQSYRNSFSENAKALGSLPIRLALDDSSAVGRDPV